MKTLNDIDITGKRCVIREDLNVPIQNGRILNDKRLYAAIPTLQMILERHAGAIILSHLGRPQEGTVDPALSLAPVAQALSEMLNHPVRFLTDYLDGIDCEPGDIILCENVRFNTGEKSNDKNLAQQYAALGDIFVMDAFGTAHRAHASTYGVAEAAKEACAGPILTSEITALTQGLKNPTRPLLGLVGGAKVSTKLNVLNGLIQTVDQLILGGGLANTLLASQGYTVGKSLYEEDLIPEMHALLETAKANNKSILIPKDVAVAKAFDKNALAEIKTVGSIADDDMILDIGPATIADYQNAIQLAGTILWNGPVGVFEFENFQEGTRQISQAISRAPGFTLAGGGETLSAIDQYINASDIDYISTGGGAFLEYLEGRKLPGIEILNQRAKETSAC